jgi:peptidoglycan/LPS O-acetylase OafA/YrhL
MKTFDDVLKVNRGIGPGFDFLRIFLATSIMLFHSFIVTNQYFTPKNFDDSPIWIVHYSLVPMFFALSGFLISGSAGRLSLKNFLINRGLRIVPALAVDCLVCALIIGPIFTLLSVKGYFSNVHFYLFFLNVIGWVHFSLPGVFVTHPYPYVNGSLWTVPFELFCYAIMSALIILKIVKCRAILPILVFIYLTTAIFIEKFALAHLGKHEFLEKLLSVAFVEHEAQAVTAFLFGIIAYQNKDKIPYSPLIFVICISILGVSALYFGDMSIGQAPLFRFFLMPALVYVTVFVGLTRVPLPKFFHTGDYSYGIYLYHQPFLQIVITLLPTYALSKFYGPGFTFLVGLPIVFSVAWISWHFVEKPILAYRKRYSIMAKVRGVEEHRTG